MRYYPVYLDLTGRPCTVIGGGEVAARKVAGLLEAGGRVTVVSPELVPALSALADTHEIVHHHRGYRRGDLAGACLAYAATGDEAVHAAIAAEAAEAGVLLNVVDRPPLCTFIVPAVVTRGEVSVAVSTAGASPALAKRVRDDVARVLGPEHALAAAILGRLRQRLPPDSSAPGARAELFAGLVASPLLEALRNRDGAAVDAILARHVGAGTTLASLGVSLALPRSDDGTAPA